MHNSKEKFIAFPGSFLWGVSTSPHQIEGGNKNDWSIWEKSLEREDGLIKAGKEPADYQSGSAANSWELYQQDFALVKKLGCGAYRLGIEWSRLELAEGEYDQAAIEHYKRELAELKQQGTKIVLTLWHWTIPLWLVKKGGWSNRSAVDYFERFAELAVKEFGEYVDFWVILNEPMVHVANGYLKAKFPPAKKNPLLAYKALKNLILAQKVAHRVIHEKLPTASVGFTVLANYIEAKDKNNFFDVKLAKIFDYWWNLYFVRKVDGFFDFLGLDYYFHDKISFKPPFLANDGQDLTDFGWEIYPEGIYEVLKHFADFKKPLYIMENGLADATDAKRADFIKKHLFFVHKAIGEGVDVRGYFHWSLIDNFEWADGFWPQFGLYMINRQTFERTPRPSAAVYAKICQDNGFWLD